MTKTLKRPEVLSPAGTLEKLKVAVQYGADAVFIGMMGLVVGFLVCYGLPKRRI